MNSRRNKDRCAVWALTENGVALAGRISEQISAVDIFLSKPLKTLMGKKISPGTRFFDKLSNSVKKEFHRYKGHIFITSTGIAVRVTAPYLRGKTIDPAVVVVDDNGRHAISLLSGHIGGANLLTQKVALIIGANAVITTATDINGLPAIDLLAVERELYIENPEAIKDVNMAILRSERLDFHDPYQLMTKALDALSVDIVEPPIGTDKTTKWLGHAQRAGVFIDDIQVELPSQVLVLRPPTLVAGIGCNRNTDREEILGLLRKVLTRHSLSPKSLVAIATASIKKDEAGLLAAAKTYGLPIRFYEKDQLNRVENIKTPSEMAEKHIGVKSVCEAAALLGTSGGKLIVPKQKTPNVTVAIARIAYTS